ncbi:MAG: hypothetical protein ACI8PZ_001409 [Myxococcota bacterium]|jgi:hypothetical protein
MDRTLSPETWCLFFVSGDLHPNCHVAMPHPWDTVGMHDETQTATSQAVTGSRTPAPVAVVLHAVESDWIGHRLDL